MTKLTANQMAQYTNKLIIGENTKIVSTWPSNYIDSIVTDPPYGIGFMGKDWDTFKPDYVNSGLKSDKTSYDHRKDKTFDHKALGSPTQIHSPAAIAGQYDYSRNHEFQQWFTIWAKAMLRVTKPGGFLLCFGGTRTYHRVTCAIEDAGWQIRDCMMWLYGSGFPKSHNISKAIDKAAGAKRETVGRKYEGFGCKRKNSGTYGTYDGPEELQGLPITKPATSLAEVWDGYGTALKPAWEPIIVAMKPLDGTFAQNAEKHSVAGLNIDGSRIGTEERKTSWMSKNSKDAFNRDDNWQPQKGETITQGRWPANIILDETSAEMLDTQTGILKSGKLIGKYKGSSGETACYGEYGLVEKNYEPTSGGASRFFYCAKTSKKERNLGCEDIEEKEVGHNRFDKCSTCGGYMFQNPDRASACKCANPQRQNNRVRGNHHPTVKPLALMKYLCTLLKMPNPNQIILDPFIGSGTTGMACKSLGINYIGIDKESDYCHIARKRIDATRKEPK